MAHDTPDVVDQFKALDLRGQIVRHRKEVLERYNEGLANQILSVLKARFPKQLATGELKKTHFAGASDGEFLLALDALHKMGLVSGEPIRSGFTDELRDLVNLEITSLGIASTDQEELKNWTSYYKAFLGEFGTAFYKRWRGKVVSGVVGALVGFLAHHDNGVGIVLKDSIVGTLFGVAIYTIYDLFRTPWLVHKARLQRKQTTTSFGLEIMGVAVFALLLAGALYWTAPLYTPRRNLPFAFSENDIQYVNVVNTLHAFKSLQNPKCVIRVTAPTENMQVARIIRSLAVDFCDVDLVYDPTAPQEEILMGSIDNAILVHMTKEPSKRDGFVTALGNVFSVRRTYELPPGSPPDLVWLQIGRGNPWRKEPTKPGTEF